MRDPNTPDALKAAARKQGEPLGGQLTSALRNALGVARERYAAHAKEMQENADKCEADPAFKAAHEGTMVNPRIYRPMQKQFEGQVEEVDQIMAWIDGPDDGEYAGQEITEISLHRHLFID